MTKPSLIILGAPGSGKGTQADKISKEFGFIHLSTGDLLRAEIEKESKLGLEVKAVMAKGDLVSDELVLALLKERFNEKNKAYILDGFPRNFKQAEMLSEQLNKNGNPYKALYFNIDLGLLKDRVINRRICKNCGEIFNLVSKPLGQNGTCTKCGSSEINHRKDDSEEVVSNRLNVFKETFSPVLKYYKDYGVLIEIDAQKSEEVVFDDLKKIISSL